MTQDPEATRTGLLLKAGKITAAQYGEMQRICDGIQGGDDPELVNRLRDSLSYIAVEDSKDRGEHKRFDLAVKLCDRGLDPKKVSQLIERNALTGLDEKEWHRLERMASDPIAGKKELNLELQTITKYPGDHKTQEYARRLGMAHGASAVDFDALNTCVEIRAETGKNHVELSTSENSCYEGMACKGFTSEQIKSQRRCLKNAKFASEDFDTLHGLLADPQMNKLGAEDACTKFARFKANQYGRPGMKLS